MYQEADSLQVGFIRYIFLSQTKYNKYHLYCIVSNACADYTKKIVDVQRVGSKIY